jgi:hypothetical protein
MHKCPKDVLKVKNPIYGKSEYIILAGKVLLQMLIGSACLRRFVKWFHVAAGSAASGR